MGKWLLAICIGFIGATMVATEADAKRLGGGRSVGTQRNVTPAPAKPAQQAAPQQQNAAQPAQQGSRWGMLGGILGGLALVLLALLAVGAVLAIRALARRRSEEPVQLAGMNQTMAPPREQPAPGGS